MAKIIWSKLEKTHPIFTEQYETFSIRGQDDFKYHEHTSRSNESMNKKDLILRDNVNNELQKILYKDAKKIGKY